MSGALEISNKREILRRLSAAGDPAPMAWRLKSPSTYLWQLNAPLEERRANAGGCEAPPAELLRLEDPDRPTPADLIPPGTLIRSSYGSYLVVDSVTPYTYYGTHRAWTVSGFSCREDGIADRRETNRGWINEIVVEWDGDRPTFRQLFIAGTDTIEIVGAGMTQNRAGQLSLI